MALKTETEQEIIVSVQNPFWLNDQLLCKTENRKFFSTLNLCYFVDKNNDFIQR